MNRRFIGILKCITIMGLDGWFCYHLSNDWQITTVVLGCAALYAFFLGEMFATLKEGAIRLDKLDHVSKSKLSIGVELMLKQYEQKYGKRKNLKVYLIPDDSQFNAYAFGIKKIGITSDALTSMDSYSAAAVLSHELGHIEGLDVCVKRLLFANMLGLLAILGMAGTMWVVIALFICMGIVWLLDSWFGLYIGIGIFKGFTKIGKGILSIGLVTAQSVIALLDRRNEFAADEFACTLGFGTQLAMVLDRYVGETAPANSLSDIMYATHPKTRKRIARIEKKLESEVTTLQNIRF